MICKFGHVAVYVDNLEWYKNMFETVFGMQVTRREQTQLWLDGGIQLVENPVQLDRGQLAHICLLVEDVPKYRSILLEHGGSYFEPDPNMIALPNGALIELKPFE